MITSISIALKKIFRKVYYFFREGSVVEITDPDILKGLKWIESAGNGRAYFKGYYEPDLQMCLSKLLHRNSVFIDIGGHAGYISLFASQFAKQVHTFEPEESNFNYIKKIIAINNLQNVNAYNVALGSQAGKLKFEKSKGATSMGKISDNGTLDVQVVSLDDFILENQVNQVDLVKIDVEGFGAEVLKGMSGAIEKFNPIIFFEFHNETEINELKKLEDRGYQFRSSKFAPLDWAHLANEFVVAMPLNSTIN